MANVKINTVNAVAEIKKLIAEIEKLKASSKNMGQPSATSLKHLEDGLKKIQNSASQTQSKIRELGTSLSNLNSKTKDLEKENIKLRNALEKVKNKLDDVNKSSKKAHSGIGMVGGGIKSLLGAFGIVAGFQLFGAIIKDAYELTKTFDSLNFTMEKITQNFYDASTSTKFLKEITQDFGVDIVTTTTRYIKFLAAAKQSGVTIGQTEDIFRSMTKAASVLGLKTEELSGIYLALEQMLSKGKVTTEELRRQLGERLPGAMGIMAEALKVTIPQLDKMLKKGEVLSADALPKFARAVELAYGITTVKTVDTLLAAQNRLTNSWKNFIETVTEGDVRIKVFLKTSMNYLSNVMNFFSKKFAKPSQQVEMIRIESGASIKKRIDADVKIRLEAMGKGADDLDAFQDKIDALSTEKILAGTQAKKNAIQLQIDELAKQRTKASQYMVDETRKYALEEITMAKKLMLDAKKAFDDLNMKKYGGTIKVGGQIRKILPKGLSDAEQEEFDGAIRSYAEKLERWDILRKTIDEPTSVAPEDNEEKTKKKFKDYEDLGNRFRQNEIQTNIDYNDRLLKDDSISFTLKKDLMERNLASEKSILDMQLETDKAKIETDRQADIKAGENKVELKKYYDGLIILAEQEHTKNMTDLKNDHDDDYLALVESEYKRAIELTKEREDEIILARDNELKVARETIKEKKELARVEAEIMKKASQLIIDESIKIVKAAIISAQAIGIGTGELEKLLKSLESMSTSPNFDDGKQGMEDYLEYASKFNDAIGDLVDAQFERKIEKINAEMDAVKKKYDEELSLEGITNERKIALERERDLKLKILEKQRLKEERKRAIAKKATALVDIAIQTAVAYTKTLGETGFFGIPLAQIILALGAIQAATVLSQPLPQYKDGGFIRKDGTAIINDGGRQEYVERAGSILTTKNKNAIVNLKSGDIVHKDFEALKRKSMIMSVIADGKDITERDFDKLSSVIESSFDKGFSRVKINNNIRVSKQTSNNNSRPLSRWSN